MTMLHKFGAFLSLMFHDTFSSHDISSRSSVASYESMYVTFLHLTWPVHGNQERVLGCRTEIGASLKGCVHRQDWPTSLQTIVLREFDSVKKGWFNVREKNVDLYRHGKLRRFLLLARLMMQDTLRNLAKMSVRSYVSTIERLAPVNVSVKSIYGAECTFRESFQNPVLTVEVRPSEGFTHFDFVLYPHRFVSTALDAYNAGLQFLNEVYPLERLMIPPRLQSSDGPSLIEAFQFDEDWVQDGYQRIQSSLENACLGPTEFLQRLQIFEPLLQRDPAALVEAFFEKDKENAEPSDQKIQEAITKETGKKHGKNVRNAIHC